MNAWTGLDFGNAAPFLAAGYGLFFLCILLGMLSLRWQARKLQDKKQVLASMKNAAQKIKT